MYNLQDTKINKPVSKTNRSSNHPKCAALCWARTAATSSSDSNSSSSSSSFWTTVHNNWKIVMHKYNCINTTPLNDSTLCYRYFLNCYCPHSHQIPDLCTSSLGLKLTYSINLSHCWLSSCSVKCSLITSHTFFSFSLIFLFSSVCD